MSAQTVTQEPLGYSVYGVPQVSYAVDGARDRDFGYAVALASLQSAEIIERETAALSNALRMRVAKLEALGHCMAVINECMAKLTTKTPESDDEAREIYYDERNGTNFDKNDTSMKKMQKELQKWGLSINVGEGSDSDYDCGDVKTYHWSYVYCSRKDLMHGQSELQKMMDLEDNDLQQDGMTVQSFVSKRDNAFSVVSEMLKKYDHAAEVSVRNFGS